VAKECVQWTTGRKEDFPAALYRQSSVVVTSFGGLRAVAEDAACVVGRGVLVVSKYRDTFTFMVKQSK